MRADTPSGTDIFAADEPEQERLRGSIERMLHEALDYAATVELRSLADMRAAVEQAPPGYGTDLDT